jgi:tripartite-type tricarboxylate transporter receptor subunit TctC
VRIIVGYPAGGGTDITARLIGQALSERLGQPFVIENRPGAATNIGTEAVVKAAPDGYTILLFDPASATNATYYDKLNFNFIRDIAPVAGVTRGAYVMVVNSNFPAKTVPEFIAYAKTNPGKVNMASPGSGTLNHLSGVLLNVMAELSMLHVPYRGSAPALADLLGGQVQVMFTSVPSAIEYIKAGKLRALALTTLIGSEALPGVPKLGDFVPGYETANWFGIGAPRGTPGEDIDKLNMHVNAALADPKIKARFLDLGGTVFPCSPDELGSFIAAETEKWGKVILAANIKPE